MYTTIELFAGGGGLALGMEKAGFKCLLVNDIDKYAVETLKHNRPNWNIIQADIKKLDFKNYNGKVDLLTGGFPCQSFSYAGKQLGLNDERGILFLEYARAIKEMEPKVFLAENVRGLLSHDGGNTIKTIKKVFEDLGYIILEPKVLEAIKYKVPQKRQRVFIIGIQKTLYKEGLFVWPEPNKKIYNLQDCLKKGELYSEDVPLSEGQQYNNRKKEILDLVPPGGYWRDLPIELQKEYMQKSFYLGGGKTGIARRISWSEPSLTLTCSPSQKQTERCHPDFTRPFTVREYARIQTFPDDWHFMGGVGQQYKQIGNAVPVNLAYYVGKSLKQTFDTIYNVN